MKAQSAATTGLASPSDARWINHNKAWTKTRHPHEVGNVKREDVRHPMHVADFNEAGIMDQLAEIGH